MDPLAIGVWFVSKSSELESIWVRNCHGSGYEGHKYHQVTSHPTWTALNQGVPAMAALWDTTDIPCSLRRSRHQARTHGAAETAVLQVYSSACHGQTVKRNRNARIMCNQMSTHVYTIMCATALLQLCNVILCHCLNFCLHTLQQILEKEANGGPSSFLWFY